MLSEFQFRVKTRISDDNSNDNSGQKVLSIPLFQEKLNLLEEEPIIVSKLTQNW